MNKIDTSPKIGAWGIIDTDNGAWLGNEAGPMTYAEKIQWNGKEIDGNLLARAGATVLGRRMRQPLRFRARLYTESANKQVDTVTMKKDLGTVLNEIERAAGPLNPPVS